MVVTRLNALTTTATTETAAQAEGEKIIEIPNRTERRKEKRERDSLRKEK